MKVSKLAKSVRNIKEKMAEEKGSTTSVKAKNTPDTVADSKPTSSKTNTSSQNSGTQTLQQTMEENETTIRKIPANRVWPD